MVSRWESRSFAPAALRMTGALAPRNRETNLRSEPPSHVAGRTMHITREIERSLALREPKKKVRRSGSRRGGLTLRMAGWCALGVADGCGADGRWSTRIEGGAPVSYRAAENGRGTTNNGVRCRSSVGLLLPWCRCRFGPARLIAISTNGLSNRVMGGPTFRSTHIAREIERSLGLKRARASEGSARKADPSRLRRSG